MHYTIESYWIYRKDTLDKLGRTGYWKDTQEGILWEVHTGPFGYWKVSLLLYSLLKYVKLVLSIGSRMAQSNNVTKDYKEYETPPSLEWETLYVNWKKEIRIWEAFTSLPEEQRAPAIFMTIRRGQRSSPRYEYRSSNRQNRR